MKTLINTISSLKKGILVKRHGNTRIVRGSLREKTSCATVINAAGIICQEVMGEMMRHNNWRGFMAALVFLPCLASAQVTQTIVAMSVTNSTDYILDSDLNEPGPFNYRENLMVHSEIRHENSGSAPALAKYQVSFRLLDSRDQPHPIYDSTGQTNSSYTQNLTNLFYVPASASVYESSAALRPAQRLNPYDQYTVEMRIRIGAEDTGQIAYAGPRAYYHFTNQVSQSPGLNVIAKLDDANYTRTYLVNTDPSKDAFLVRPQVTLRRWEPFEQATLLDNVVVHLDYELREASTGIHIPLQTSRKTVAQTLPGSVVSNPSVLPSQPFLMSFTELLEIRPLGTLQLDSVNKTYEVTVTVRHIEMAGQQPVTGNSAQLPEERLLHFNGRLFFGPIETRFGSIDNDPQVNEWVANSHVETRLGVEANSGHVIGKATHTYGNGSTLKVRLLSNGDAELQSGAVGLNAPSPDNADIGRVRFRRHSVRLSNAGAHSDLTVHLPTGFGYRANMNGRMLNSTLPFTAVELTQTLTPSTDLVQDGPRVVSEESKPFWVEASSVRWEVSKGQFILEPTGFAQYVRAGELNRLEGAPLSSQMRTKRSNAQVFRSVDQVFSSTITVLADNQGHARMTLAVGLGAGQFTTHFPYDTRVEWHQSGQMVITNDLVTQLESYLNAAQQLTGNYARDCQGPDCQDQVGPDQVTVLPAGGKLHFTVDGGLVADGPLATPQPLSWGYIASYGLYAQRTREFSEAGFHMPGSFLRGDQSGTSPANRPGVLHLTGVRTNALREVERPLTPAYAVGFGDYAGFNFRVNTDGAVQAESVIASQPTGLYPLTGRSKYYMRWSGVSGIHEAVFGSFPEEATLYGYEFNIRNYGLSYQSGENIDSRTEGNVEVRYPSDFAQSFEELKFTCLGALLGAKVPSGETGLEKLLSYWNADFSTLAIAFDRDESVTCDPGIGYLVLGVRAHATHVEEPLFGSLGFKNDGNLITAKDIASQEVSMSSGFNSRLKLPNNFKLKGPAKEIYNINPVTDVFYNNWDFGKQEPQGYLSVAAKMDVPFFPNLKVHIHTSAKKNTTGQSVNGISSIHLMAGFSEGGQSYFSQPLFDTDNRGIPQAATLTSYRAGDSAQHRIHAERSWLEIVDFDYPLRWDSAARIFTSFEEVKDDIGVVNVENKVKYMSPEKLRLEFGAGLDAAPFLNIASLGFSLIDGEYGVVGAFVRAGLQDELDALTDGFGRLDQALRSGLRDFMSDQFYGILQPEAERLYAALKADYNDSNPNSWSPKGVVDDHLDDYVLEVFRKVIGSSPKEVGVLKELERTLDAAIEAIDTIQKITTDDDAIGTLGESIMKSFNEYGKEFYGSIVDGVLDPYLKEVDPTLDQLHVTLEGLKQYFIELKSQLEPTKDLQAELQEAVDSRDEELKKMMEKLKDDLTLHFAQLNNALDHPFNHYDQVSETAWIRNTMENAFYATTIDSAIRQTLRHRLYDADALFREATDSVFQQINTVIRDFLSETLSSLDKEFRSLVNDKMAMAVAQIQGYAHINGDSLKLLRLDVYAQMSLAGSIEFNAHFQIKEIDSEGTSTACTTPSGQGTEVTMGATDAKVNWFDSEATINVSSKFTFDTGGAAPVLVNMGGGFDSFRQELSSMSRAILISPAKDARVEPLKSLA